jgi:hypothetical protein
MDLVLIRIVVQLEVRTANRDHCGEHVKFKNKKTQDRKPSKGRERE